MYFLIPSILSIIQILSALTVILLVLFQQGKGSSAGMDSFFGASAGGFFGSVGAENFMSRMIKWSAVVFFLCTIWLSYSDRKNLQVNSNLESSIMRNEHLDLEHINNRSEKDEETSIPDAF